MTRGRKPRVDPPSHFNLAMKPVAHVALLLLFSTPSLALNCYSCLSSISPGCGSKVSSDIQPKLCDRANCVSTRTGTGPMAVYQRECLAACVAGTVNGTTRKCCQTDGCNGDFGDDSSVTEAPKPPTTTKAPSEFQCYSCDTSGDSKCTKTAVCTDENPVCASSKVSLPFVGSSYLHGCMSKDDCEAALLTECCYTSLCNAGATIRVSVFVILVAVFVALFVRN